MPRRRNGKKRRPRRRAKRRSAMRRRRPVRPGFPKSRLVKMRYVEALTLDPAAGGVLAKYTYSANNIFDPSVTAAGHQPLGHDQWAAFYNDYVVLGSKITVIWSSSTATNATSIPNICGICLDEDNSIAVSSINLIENNARYTVLPMTNNSRRTTRRHFSTKKFFNVTNVKDNVARFGAGFGASPTEQAYFILFVGPVTLSDDTPGVSALVTIDYIVALSSPKDLVES